MKELLAVGVLRPADFGTLADFSLYRGLLILWDEDHDGRLLAVVDWLLDHYPEATAGLLAITEHKGACVCWWWGQIGFQGTAVPTPDADTWTVEHRVIPARGEGRHAVRP